MNTDKKQIPGRGLTLVFISWIVVAITYFVTLGVGMLIPAIREQFNLDLATTGYFSTITFVVTVILLIPISLVCARSNPKYVVGFVFACAALSLYCHVFAKGAVMLLVGRGFLAIGLNAITPPMAMVKKSWIPISRMTSINGLDQFAGTAGQLLGTVGVTALIFVFGNWQNMMLVFAIILTIVTFLWLLVYKENPQNPVQLSKGEPILAPLKEAFKEKSVWLLALGWPGTTLVWIAFTTFWPTFATETLGFSLSQAGLAIGMIPLGSLLACLVAPLLNDLIGYDKLMIWPWGIILCLAYFGGTVTNNIVFLCATFFIGGFASFAFVPTAFTILYKLGSLSSGGTSMGLSIILTVANIGGALAGIIVGKLIGFMALKNALVWCCLSPLLFVATTLFLPELGRKAQNKIKSVA